MRLIATITTILLASSMALCQNVTNNKKQKTMGTIQLTTQEFKKNVFNYETEKTFKYLGNKPAIVDFYATWCGPCKALSPVLEELAKEYDGKIVIYKVDVDKNQELAAAFGIRSIPTLLVIPMDGKPSMSAGAPSKAQLKSIIENMLKAKEK